MTELHADPGLQAIRKVRHEISEEIEHDPKRLIASCHKLEQEYEDRLVHAEGRGREVPEAAGGRRLI